MLPQSARDALGVLFARCAASAMRLAGHDHRLCYNDHRRALSPQAGTQGFSLRSFVMAVLIIKREEVERVLDAIGGAETHEVLPPKELEAFASMMDHACLRPDARREDIMKLAEEAKRWNTAVACVYPSW